MADEPQVQGGPQLPPKLDLRRAGVIKIEPPRPVGASAPASPAPVPPSIATPVAAPSTVPPADPIRVVTPAEKPVIPLSSQSVDAIRIVTPTAGTAGSDPKPTPGNAVPRMKPVTVGAAPTTGTPGAVRSAGTMSIVVDPAGPGTPVKPVVVGSAPSIGEEKKTLSKRETSKIPLEAAIAPKTEADAKPGVLVPAVDPTAAGAPSTIRLARPGVVARAADPALPSAAPADPKRKTSRISLEAALAPEGTTPVIPPEAPKTIRLKRPSEAPTLKVTPNAEMMKPSDRPAEESSSKTARLDEAAEASDESSPTRRRTIRVKRPTSAGEVVEGEEGETESEGVAAVRARPAAPKEGPVFTGIALGAGIITLIILMVTIYCLCAEAFGPHLCIADKNDGSCRYCAPLAYSKDGPNLSWPGKVY